MHFSTVDPLERRGSATSNNNFEIGTLAVDEWAVTFGTERGGLSAVAARPGPRCTKCFSPPINGHCTSHRIAV